MANENIIEAIQRTLKEFGEGMPLLDFGEKLLKVLGYESDVVIDFESVEEFLEGSDAHEKLTEKQQKLFTSWQDVKIVSQFTTDEVQAETDLRPNKAFDEGDNRGRYDAFLFFAVDLADGAYTRSTLAEMTRATNRLYLEPVIIMFRHDTTMTLAVVHRRAHLRDDERDVLEKVTLIKDIRLNNPHRAHLDILGEIYRRDLIGQDVKNFDELHERWEETLSIRELNKKFYKELYQWFEYAKDETRFPDDGAGTEEESIKERHIIRLITRLLFVWFLKEKRLVPAGLFTEEFANKCIRDYSRDSTDYYQAILQNLFFATLNTEIDKRQFSKRNNSTHRDFSKYRYHDLLKKPKHLVSILRTVPFVNGGLFDCLDYFEGKKEGGRHIDVFTDNKAQRKELYVPARLFFDQESGLFPLFERYKFTIEESTPIDQEVALDPELLGRVFENLLAAYNENLLAAHNPRVNRTVRSSTGSYYTPRHIVDYMVEEVLVEALMSNGMFDDDDRERLCRLMDYECPFDHSENIYSKKETKTIINSIAKLRILDPAVGSGAFPMGVLHKLTLVLRRLDPHNTYWEELQKTLAAERARAIFNNPEEGEREMELIEISKTFDTYRDSDFGRKLYLMQNSIFGVDIQPIACQITKLRFFISLIVEQRTNEREENFGIKPLPNLETRFVAANTLIDLGMSQQSVMVLGKEKVREIEDRLRKIREKHFNARTREQKRRIRNEDKKVRREMAEKLEQYFSFGHDDAQAIADWDPYDQNARAAWFEPEYMFGVSEGFDAVIGNPPYIRGENIQQEDKKQLRLEYNNFYTGRSDIYTYFFKKGVDLIKNNGLLCYITSNKFMKADYGERLRKFLRAAAPPLMFLDFGKVGTFDATVRPSVILIKKGGRNENFRSAMIDDDASMAHPSRFMKEKSTLIPIASLRDTGWSISEPRLLALRDSIESMGVPLKDYLKNNNYGNICYGVKTGLNEAFIIDSDKKRDLVAQDPKCSSLIKPMLRGKDILDQWSIGSSGLYLICIPSRLQTPWPWSNKSEKAAARIFKKEYPSLYDHLGKFEDQLHDSSARGYYFWELSTLSSYDIFEQPKIIYRDISAEMRAVVDYEGYFANNTCFIIPNGDEYIASLLNSMVLDVYYRLTLQCLDDPFNNGHMRFINRLMNEIPIVEAPRKTRRHLSILAREIQSKKGKGNNADVLACESQMNEIIFSLYGINKRDSKLITEAVSDARRR